MNYFKANKLYVVEQEVKKTKTVNVPKGVNHLFVYDRSGSMGGVLDDLTKDLKTKLRDTKTGDTVSIGWFSGTGQFNWPLKGYKVEKGDDFKTIDKIIDQNDHTIGMTCFSEVLADSETVVNDLKPFGNTYSLMFFTDGMPTVYPYETEIKKIFSAIDRIAGKVAVSLLVGYGNYYNKELMSQMAERLGGTLIHQSDLSGFTSKLDAHMERSRSSEPKVLVELQSLPHSNGFAFSVSDTGVAVLAVENGKVAFTPTKAATDYVYVVTDKKPSGGTDVTTKVQTSHKSVDTMLKATYGAALGFVQRGNTDLALDVLSALGDVALVTSTNNAFTNADYGKVEDAIVNAMNTAAARWVGGRKVNCLPSEDALCLLDVLDLLQADEAAEFQPFHEEFKYTKVTGSTKTKDGYPTFHPDKETRVPLGALVWNDTKLNLSMRAKINGHIDTPKGPKVGLGKTYDTYVYRNYTIVKDGCLNVQKLPVAVSKSTYDTLLKEGLIDKEHDRHYPGRVYLVHLDRIPVVNRKIARANTSAKDLCKESLEEMKIMADLKVFNYLRNEVEPKDERTIDDALTQEQEDYLKELGVTRGGFNPPTEKLPSTDFYMAKEFEIKIKGLSSLPKVDEVVKKTADKKASLTTSQQLVAEALKVAASVYKPGEAPNSKEKTVLMGLDALILDSKNKLRELRTGIQKAKFAVLLGKTGFNDLNMRTDNKLTVKGHDFTIDVREVKVEI